MDKVDCAVFNTSLRSVYSIKFYSCFSLSHQFQTHSRSHIPRSIFKREWGPWLLGKGGSWASSQGDTFQNPQLSRDPQQPNKSEVNGGIPKALKENFYPGKFFYLFQKISPSVKIFQWGNHSSSRRRALSRSCRLHHQLSHNFLIWMGKWWWIP